MKLNFVEPTSFGQPNAFKHNPQLNIKDIAVTNALGKSTTLVTISISNDATTTSYELITNCTICVNSKPSITSKHPPRRSPGLGRVHNRLLQCHGTPILNLSSLNIISQQQRKHKIKKNLVSPLPKFITSSSPKGRPIHTLPTQIWLRLISIQASSARLKKLERNWGWIKPGQVSVATLQSRNTGIMTQLHLDSPYRTSL